MPEKGNHLRPCPPLLDIQVSNTDILGQPEPWSGSRVPEGEGPVTGWQQTGPPGWHCLTTFFPELPHGAAKAG